MANAQFKERKIETIVVQEEEIVLRLSREEAEAVMSFAGHVHLLNSDKDVIAASESVYRELREVVGGFFTYKPVALDDTAVTWERKR